MKHPKPLRKKKRTARGGIVSRLDAFGKLIESLQREVRNLKARISRTDIHVNYVDSEVGAVKSGVRRAEASRSYEKFIRGM